MKKVLFLCTGNSCRSQMAEAIVNAHFRDQWQAFSAGTKPTGTVHPKVFRVLSEIDILHEGESKSVDRMRDIEFDLVITVCDDAAENCPIWLGKGKRHHISFSDPAKVEGDEEQIMSAFRYVRDAISNQIINFLSSYAGDEASSRRN